MKAKILKKVSSLVFFLLMIAVAVPTSARSNDKNKRLRKNNVNVRTTFSYTNNGPAWNVRIGNHRNGRVVTRVNRNRRFHHTYRRGYGRAIPRVGLRVDRIPTNKLRFRKNGRDFYLARGVFYARAQYGFRIVQPPIGARLGFLPRGARGVFVNGQHYYKIDNVLLEPIANRDGLVRYHVVGLI